MKLQALIGLQLRLFGQAVVVREASIGLTSSTIDGTILWPLPIAALGFTMLFASVVLMRMRALLADAKVEARLKRLATA